MSSNVSGLSIMAGPAELHTVTPNACQVTLNGFSRDPCHVSPREAARALLAPHWQKYGEAPTVVHLCAGVVILVFCVVAVIGNGLVIFVFLRSAFSETLMPWTMTIKFKTCVMSIWVLALKKVGQAFPKLYLHFANLCSLGLSAVI